MNRRRKALEALYEITEQGAYANLCLKEVLHDAAQADAAWVSAAVYTTLDHLCYIDFLIDAYAKGRIAPRIRCLLRLGLCQALYMDIPVHTACDESVKLAKQIGKGALSGLVNALMRTVCRDSANGKLPPLPEETVERLSVDYSWPRFLVEEYVSRYGAAFAEELLKGREHAGMTVRAQHPYSALALEDALQKRAIAFTRGKYVSDAFHLANGLQLAKDDLFLSGKIAVQSESSMLVCRALGVRDGMRVLDACAAPGGKSAYLSQLMHGSGEIVACELHAHRCKLMEETFARLHIENTRVRQQDAAEVVPEFIDAFDAVLTDVPCSGLGVTGKPDVRYAKRDEMIRDLAVLQSRILDTCSRYVKTGGTLVYSTCTVSVRENELIADAFLAAHPDFTADLSALRLPESLQARAAQGRLQLFPHLDGTDGFFFASFRRIK